MSSIGRDSAPANPWAGELKARRASAASSAAPNRRKGSLGSSADSATTMSNRGKRDEAAPTPAVSNPNETGTKCEAIETAAPKKKKTAKVKKAKKAAVDETVDKETSEASRKGEGASKKVNKSKTKMSDKKAEGEAASVASPAASVACPAAGENDGRALYAKARSNLRAPAKVPFKTGAPVAEDEASESSIDRLIRMASVEKANLKEKSRSDDGKHAKGTNQSVAVDEVGKGVGARDLNPLSMALVLCASALLLFLLHTHLPFFPLANAHLGTIPRRLKGHSRSWPR